MSPSVTVWLIDVFVIVFGQQWSSTAQRKKIYQVLIHTVLVRRIHSLLAWVFFMGFVDS